MAASSENDTVMQQIERIDAELAELNRLLLDNELYKPVEALYHEPQEVPGFTELLSNQRSFEPRLKYFLKKRFAEQFSKEQERKETFKSYYRTWNSKIKVLEAKDPVTSIPPALAPTPSAFPPSKTSKEQPSIAGTSSSFGRSSRRTTISDAVRSEEEMNRILLSLLEQERDNPLTRWMATLAVTPRMHQVDPKHIFDDLFIDTNGKQEDLLLTTSTKKEEVLSPAEWASSVVHYNENVVWTEGDEKTFIDKFLVYPKNFRKIASFLPFKKTADCVAFYYRSKKRLRLKQLRKMAVSEANAGKVKLGRKSIHTSGAGPGRPVKKLRKPGRPPKTIRYQASSVTEDDDSSDFSASLATTANSRFTFTNGQDETEFSSDSAPISHDANDLFQ